jgi:hypothetical protein
VHEHLDTPSPYYEGFYKENKGKIKTFVVIFAITRFFKDNI